MKLELLENTKVAPYTSGGVINRTGFLSLVFAATVAVVGSLVFTVTHSDDGEKFEPVTDTNLFIEKPTKNGVFTIDNLAAKDTVNVDVNLSGLKNYVKIEVSGDAASGASFAYAIGDSNIQPV